MTAEAHRRNRAGIIRVACVSDKDLGVRPECHISSVVVGPTGLVGAYRSAQRCRLVGTSRSVVDPLLKKGICVHESKRQCCD